MESISFNIWSVIILLGAAQGILLSIYLFRKSENRSANKWLALLATAISLHLFEYGATISGITLKYPFLFASTYPLLFCFGPFYYFYCRRLLDKNYTVNVKSLAHFIPAVLVLLMMLPFYSMDQEQKRSYLHSLASNDRLTIPAEQLMFMAIHVIQTVIYTCAAYKFIVRKETGFKDVTSDVFLVKKINWLNTFSFYFAIFLTLYFLLVLALTFTDSYQVQMDYVMLLITSFSLYGIGYQAVQNPEIFKSLPEFEPEVKAVNHEETLAEIPNIRKFPELKESLLELMETNKPYLKSDLKISELAGSLSVPYHQLSQFINDEFLVNFYDFINKYRVEEAKKLLLEAHHNFKILAVAYESGFNSKATFNRVFKKFTGLTPSEFREKFRSATANVPGSDVTLN